ncbi:hypothetical protein DEA8626_00373 [Defluviimonas aquaemixtae]|uniref:Uncharacterized protein n=1 Tax=Albidovulum aquaemixtae TaxID=1542388 RepID=A0A2R8B2J5_9RHOB|nr:hypothetical protein [Defluviimonas aquaemixtae]SPH16859.1 hypothetical protein DEA8626_00373 [Defluviimonas aquaemixtae]
MLIFFISTVAAGFAAAGVVMLLNRLSGRRLPKWAIPAAAGLAMVAYAIWNEYSWAERNRATLPDTAVVTFENARSDLWRPWTFVAPVTTRMAILDRGPEADLPADPGPGMRHAQLYLMERWKPIYRLIVLFDCASARRLDAAAGEASAADLAVADWIQLDPDDPALRAACEGGGNG